MDKIKATDRQNLDFDPPPIYTENPHVPYVQTVAEPKKSAFEKLAGFVFSKRMMLVLLVIAFLLEMQPYREFRPRYYFAKWIGQLKNEVTIITRDEEATTSGLIQSRTQCETNRSTSALAIYTQCVEQGEAPGWCRRKRDKILNQECP